MSRSTLLLGLIAVLAIAAVGGGQGPTDTSAPALRAQLARERDHFQAERVRLVRVARYAPSVDEALTIAAVVYGVDRGELAAVAFCESRLSSGAQNGRYRGLFQEGPMFERGPYGQAGLSVWSPYASALTAARVVSREGWRQWSCRP